MATTVAIDMRRLNLEWPYDSFSEERDAIAVRHLHTRFGAPIDRRE